MEGKGSAGSARRKNAVERLNRQTDSERLYVGSHERTGILNRDEAEAGSGQQRLGGWACQKTRRVRTRESRRKVER